MTTSEKFMHITREPDCEKKIAMIDALTGDEAKEILKAFVRHFGR